MIARLIGVKWILTQTPMSAGMSHHVSDVACVLCHALLPQNNLRPLVHVCVEVGNSTNPPHAMWEDTLGNAGKIALVLAMCNLKDE